MKKKKLAAAVELGRLGGLKGGPARAEKLSAKRRSDIARHAAETRWANYENTPALQAQIEQGYRDYQSGNYRPIDAFMQEMEGELKHEENKRKEANHRTRRKRR